MQLMALSHQGYVLMKLRVAGPLANSTPGTCPLHVAYQMQTGSCHKSISAIGEGCIQQQFHPEHNICHVLKSPFSCVIIEYGHLIKRSYFGVCPFPFAAKSTAGVRRALSRLFDDSFSTVRLNSAEAWIRGDKSTHSLPHICQDADAESVISLFYTHENVPGSVRSSMNQYSLPYKT